MPYITVLSGHKQTSISYDDSEGRTLNAILYDSGIILNTVCGGNGFCGKCSVKVGKTMQKACIYVPSGDISVIIPKDSINTAHSSQIPEPLCQLPTRNPDYETARRSHASQSCNAGHISAAVDIGSTTISAAIAALKDDYFEIIDSSSIYNPTAIYGSDVISRIQSSINGNRDVMSSLLWRSIEDLLCSLLEKNGIPHGQQANHIENAYISCNTAMQYVLMGIDCQGLTGYPFLLQDFKHTFSRKDMTVHIIPSFSAFVGGDIVSGTYYLSPSEDERFILLDLGTNAEIVLANRGELFCTSAAAGPAFEGAGITCGTAYVNGAICGISLRYSRVRGSYSVSYNTIGNKLPCGICGSGILDAYSQFITHGVIDEHRTFAEKYIDTGFEIAHMTGRPLIITQDDIRQIQLAVSAIRTGIEILLMRAGIDSDSVDKVYIAGSFGKSLKLSTLENIGLFPAGFLRKGIISFAGNTSLLGAIKAAKNGCMPADFSALTEKCTEVELANEPGFNSLFMKNI